MRIVLASVYVFALTACSMVKTSTTSPGTSSGGPPSGGVREASQAPDDGRMAGIVHRDEFQQMRGMTVDQAKAFAKKLGHTGTVKVDVASSVMDGCTETTVCTATDELGGQSGMKLSDTLLLTTNPSSAKSAPPRD